MAAFQPVSTVLIGYGYGGRTLHARLLKRCAEIHLRGVFARSADLRQTAVADLGASLKTYETFEAVLADVEVELVVIATPHPTHAQYAIAALNHGKHVIVDKLMCLTLSDCDAMIAAAEANKRMLTVFHNRRLDGDFLTVHKLLQNGTLGDVRWIELSWQKFGLSKKAWKNAPIQEGGGSYNDLGAHLVDQALQLFPGPIKSVYARFHFDFEAAKDVDSHATLHINFADGRTVVIDTSTMSCAPKPRFYLLGTQGTFMKYGVDPQEDALSKDDLESSKEDPATYGTLAPAPSVSKEHIRIETQPGNWLSYYQQAASAVRQGYPYQPSVSPQSVRRALTVLFAGIESARLGQVVELNNL